jgi:hypothetical protein
VLADRCYARHGGMGAVWTQGADLVVRYGLSSSALQDEAGHRVTLNDVLRRPGVPVHSFETPQFAYAAMSVGSV